MPTGKLIAGAIPAFSHLDKVDGTVSLKRVYGRGFVDALKAVGIKDIKAVMNQAKLRQQEQALNGQARKVYESIPIETSITYSQLMTQITNKIGRPDVRVIESCLNDIVERGLVRRTPEGKFQRIKPHIFQADIQEDKIEMTTTLKVVPTAPLQSNPIELFRQKINEASECLNKASDVLAELHQLSIQVETENAKLQRLKDALESLRQ